eukprot:g4537.t1
MVGTKKRKVESKVPPSPQDALLGPEEKRRLERYRESKANMVGTKKRKVPPSPQDALLGPEEKRRLERYWESKANMVGTKKREVPPSPQDALLGPEEKRRLERYRESKADMVGTKKREVPPSPQDAPFGPEEKRRRMLAAREQLPVYAQREAITEAVAQHQCVIVVGETGSGKTTQIPQFLLHAGLAPLGSGQHIGVTQPRRVAAITLAQRVADELGTSVGDEESEVGYAVRFDTKTSSNTRIKFVTDGMLLREAIGDADLGRYSVVVLDEAHERSVHTDVLLGLLKRLLSRRPMLKLVVMSATLDVALFQGFLGAKRTKVLHVSGRQHPVAVHYTREPQADYVEAAMLTVLQLHEQEPLAPPAAAGGAEAEASARASADGAGRAAEIEGLARLLQERAKEFLSPRAPALLVQPLFAAMPAEKQLEAFRPAPASTRKVILATNIAETSITIPGVRFVVDPGFVKMRAVHPRTGTETLWVEPVSRQQAWQRAGRAGRLGPGKCFRLYPEKQFPKLRATTVPMLHRCNLAHVALQLLALGITDLLAFEFPQPPRTDALRRALETLWALGALDKAGSLTELGRHMASLPLEPQLARLLLTAPAFGCAAEVLSLTAVLAAGAESPFFATPSDQEQAAVARAAHARMRAPDGDHLTLLNAFQRAAQFEEEGGGGAARWCREHFVHHRSLRKALDIRTQLAESLLRLGIDTASSCAPETDPVRRCLVQAAWVNAALHEPSSGARGEYKTVRTGQLAYIHPTSVLFNRAPKTRRCVIFHELVDTSKLYMRTLTAVDEAWLLELAPEFVERKADQHEHAGAGRRATGPQ